MHDSDTLLPSSVRRRGAKAAKAVPKNDPNYQPLDIPRGADDPTSITGKRGGRPAGSKNTKSRDVREMLKRSDPAAVREIMKILDWKPVKECSMEMRLKLADTKLRAIALAWAYRWGKPREMTDPDAPPMQSGASPFTPIQAQAVNVYAVRVGGTKDQYIDSLRQLGSVSAIPLPAPQASDA